ncbi:DinB family protein [Jiella sp. M17.18]|uniref:DinB family protein n=1 Tax=Jiella sp. M17.18 TaxID=3234247 RepID=UPI0034DF4BE8
MISPETARMFARYNAWCNGRLYAAAAELPEADLSADRGVFFGSMMGTLNHLLVTDRIWMKRFTGTGEAPNALDAILFDAFAPLRKARQTEDERIVAWVESLSERDLGATFTYRPVTNPRDITQPLSPALSHLFNHQTHHRGQAHAILTGLGRPAPSFDLIAFQRETGIGMG